MATTIMRFPLLRVLFGVIGFGTVVVVLMKEAMQSPKMWPAEATTEKVVNTTLLKVTEQAMVTSEESESISETQTNLREDVASKEPLKEKSFHQHSNVPSEQINPMVIIGGQSYNILNVPSNFLPLPKPILVVGMPKAGTTAIYKFFYRMKFKASHWDCALPNQKRNLCGHCIRRAIQENHSKMPLKDCNNFEVVAQLDTIANNNTGGCHFPQMLDMDVLHNEVPNATLILNRRNMTRWVNSVRHWGVTGRGLDKRFVACGREQGPASTSEKDLIEWHYKQIEFIRRFVQQHPSHALVEIDIEGKETGQQMANLFDGQAKFWGQANKNT